MKYAVLIYDHPDHWGEQSPDEARAVTAEYMDIRADERVYAGERLGAADTATTVRVVDGAPMLTDGPFVDSKEFLGGFFLVEADDLDGALELAARIPAARVGGAVEVRPIAYVG